MPQVVPDPDIALSRHAHDRIGDHRVDDAWMAAAWDDPGTRVLVLAGARFQLTDGHLDWQSSADALDGTRVLLGEREGVVHFAVVTDPSDADDTWVGLRAAVADVDPDDADLLVHAVGIAEWLLATRHCPYCGGVLTVDHGGHQQTCTVCGRPQFPRSDPAVIMVVVDGEAPDDRCLLGRNPAWPARRYSTLAGFVEPGESVEHAVRREVAEETGVRVGEVRYFGSQPWPMPASLMMGFVATAESTDVTVDGEEIEDARWFTREEMRLGAEDGSLVLPGGISISRALVEWWYGEPLPGSW